MNDRKASEFVAFARRVAEEETSWADWHNRVYGIDGEFGKLFPSEVERRSFFESSYQSQIEEISASLRNGVSIQEYTMPVTTTSASGKFVVRIPTSLHEALSAEARREGVSLNQLVLTKLALNLRAATQKLVNNNSSLCTN